MSYRLLIQNGFFFLLLWILPYHLDKSVVQNLTLHHGNEISTKCENFKPVIDK